MHNGFCSNVSHVVTIYMPQVVNQTCVEIRSVVPAQVCIGSTENITLNGRGFTNKLIQGQSACRFKTGDGRFYCKGTCITINLQHCEGEV